MEALLFFPRPKRSHRRRATGMDLMPAVLIASSFGLTAVGHAQMPVAVPADAAVIVAEQTAPREQMRGMVLATLSRTTTTAIIAKKLGDGRTSVLLAAETDRVVDLYGSEWAALLAAAYRETLDADELAKAQTAFQLRDRVAMMPLMERVGPVMQRKATPLLERASKEALLKAYEQMMKEPAQ